MGIRTEVAKNNIIYTVGNIAAAALSFVFSIIVARMLQPEQFGLFSFALVVMGFFVIFIDLGTNNTFIRFASDLFEKKQNSKVRSVLSFFFKFKMLLALLVGAIMLLFPGSISAGIFGKPESELFIVLAAFMLIANSAFEFMNMVFVAFKNFSYIIILRLVERVLRIGLVLALVALGLGAVGAVSGVAVVFAIVAVAGGVLIARRYRCVLNARGPEFRKKALVSFGFWAMVGATITNVYLVTDSLLISILRPVWEVGFYSISASWMTLITYLVPISYTVMYPYFSGLDEGSKFKALGNSIKYALIVALPLALLMSAFSSPIISILYGSSFAPAAEALRMLSLVSVTLVISPLLFGYLYGMGKPMVHTLFMVVFFGLNIGLNYFMINLYGIWGAATATLLARTLEIAVFIAFIRISMNCRFEWRDFMKPAIAALIIYIVASLWSIGDIYQMVAYGIALLAVYLGIMLAIGGISRSDIRRFMGMLFRRRMASKPPVAV